MNRHSYSFAWGSPRGKKAGEWMNSVREGLYGQRCRVLCRGRMNSCLIETERGERHVVSRNALRKHQTNETKS